MPVYTYHCEACENEFEKHQTFSEEPLTTCPQCQEKALRKVYRPAMVMFKGSGYYVTDHRSSKSTQNNVNNKPSSENGSGDSKTESKPNKSKEPKTKKTAESKTESK
jgi:putative FmdB family regulatory protein